MASEREEAKKAITTRQSDEPELDDTLKQAHALQHQLAIKEEEHRHKEAMRATELGWIGRIIGGEATAAVTAAFIVVFAGLFMAAACLGMAVFVPTAADFWAKQSERTAVIATSALAFIFGKGSSRQSR